MVGLALDKTPRVPSYSSLAQATLYSSAGSMFKGNPVVYFDVAIGGRPAGRIEMTVSSTLLTRPRKNAFWLAPRPLMRAAVIDALRDSHLCVGLM